MTLVNKNEKQVIDTASRMPAKLWFGMMLFHDTLTHCCSMVGGCMKSSRELQQPSCLRCEPHGSTPPECLAQWLWFLGTSNQISKHSVEINFNGCQFCPLQCKTMQVTFFSLSVF